MDAQSAVDELALLSTQVVEAVILADVGIEAATTTGERAGELARAGRELLQAAAAVPGSDGVERIEVALDAGCLHVLRDDERSIVATTVPDAPSGLVLYDLRTALRRAGITEKRASRRGPGRRAGGA